MKKKSPKLAIRKSNSRKPEASKRASTAKSSKSSKASRAQKKKQAAARPSRKAKSSSRKSTSSRQVKKIPTKVLPETIASLRRALDALLSSPRFEFVKRLQAGELVVKVGKPGGLKDFCLEDLTMLGAEEVSRIAHVNDHVLLALAEVIQGMAVVAPGAHFESPGLMPGSAPAIDFPVTQRSRYPTPDLPSFSSSEAEVKLITLLTKLKSMSAIGKFYSKRLGDYWLPEWPKAPFEQQMTVRQVLEINIDAVLKKRSFTGQKLSAFMQALERIADEASQESPSEREQREPTPSPKSFAKLAVPTSLRFTLLGLENDLYRLPQNHPLRRVYFPLSEWLTAGHALSLARALDEKPSDLDLGAALTADTQPSEDAAIPIESSKSLVSAIGDRITEKAPSLEMAWKAALSGPALGYAKYFAQELTNTLDEQVQKSLFGLIFQALGSSPLLFRGSPVRDHWAPSPKSFGVLFESFLSGPSRSEGESSRELMQLFPLADQGILLELVAKYANRNELGT